MYIVLVARKSFYGRKQLLCNMRFESNVMKIEDVLPASFLILHEVIFTFRNMIPFNEKRKYRWHLFGQTVNKRRFCVPDGQSQFDKSDDVQIQHVNHNDSHQILQIHLPPRISFHFISNLIQKYAKHMCLHKKKLMLASRFIDR